MSYAFNTRTLPETMKVQWGHHYELVITSKWCKTSMTCSACLFLTWSQWHQYLTKITAAKVKCSRKCIWNTWIVYFNLKTSCLRGNFDFAFVVTCVTQLTISVSMWIMTWLNHSYWLEKVFCSEELFLWNNQFPKNCFENNFHYSNWTAFPALRTCAAS